ncbi:hypothetical protein [Dictyobacter aurantiacus]|uniref:C-type cytochrome biogenesis protein CcmI n=1 Tax=Dictyobacter aurantiacus TaxID=1936993 RepID=A0A401ZBJ9_9CHLR|nr:hypothetical protein [Dictyobacter aurantiacus]GCE04281.1 hypothetical protein KDAU_16100 [Dictyobacter aurantiacus]
MALIIAMVLGLLSLVFVLYPLYTGSMKKDRQTQVEMEREQPETEVKELAEDEQQARSSIQEVELDYQLGNIEEPDYRSLRERYMRRALTALKSRYEREQEIDDDIEQQLRQLKESYEKTNHE